MMRRALGTIAAVLVALPLAAESKPVQQARPAPTAQVAQPTRPAAAVKPRVAVGRSVEVSWGGQWWAAEVLESRSGIRRIHYTGWGAEWDEWVGPDRVRAATAAAPVVPLKAARVGQRIDVEWHGSWWPAEVVSMKNGFYKIHYAGWDTEWDEWVELPRMRAPASTPGRAPGKTQQIVGGATF